MISIPVPIRDHGKFIGLLDDDHEQYALLSGRSGGTTFIGGTQVTDILKLQGTSGIGTPTSTAIQLLTGNNGDIVASAFDNVGRMINTASLIQASGNEIAYQFNATVNKAAGDDTLIKGVHTDTATPGTSYLIDLWSGAAGAESSKFRVDNTGILTASLGPVFGGSVKASGFYSLTNSISYFASQSISSATAAVWAAYGTYSHTSGTFTAFKITPVYNQTSGNAANTDSLIMRTETAIGSGEQLFLAMGTVALGVLTKFRNDGVWFPRQAPTVSAPTYTLGGVYFDTTLNKLMIGGAAGWETITSA